jgi:uncharacterized GH25 family protein
MRNPEQARASEIVVIKITDNEGKPVSGARIYSTAQLGDTAGDGTLAISTGIEPLMSIL